MTEQFSGFINGLNVDLSNVGDEFFTKKNMTFIQEQIKIRVYQKSGNKYVLSRQSDEELIIVMRSIYATNRPDLHGTIHEQLYQINCLVVDECTRLILPMVEQYIGFLHDIDNPIHIMDHSRQSTANTSNPSGSFH